MSPCSCCISAVAQPDCAWDYGIVPIGEVVPGQDYSGCTVCDQGRECINLLTGAPCGETPEPTEEPSAKPTENPTAKPTENPTAKPTEEPTSKPTEEPTEEPTENPTANPTAQPSAEPSQTPTGEGESAPSETPSKFPSVIEIEKSCPDVPIDFCVAIDMSGSVCTIPPNGATTCPPGTSKEECWAPADCDPLLEMKGFVVSIVERVHAIGDNKQFATLTFSNDANTQQGLTSSESAAVSSVQDASYVGGLTNTGDAINACRNILKDSNNEKVLMLVTDGTPTTGSGSRSGDCAWKSRTSYAKCEADKAKEEGITILPVYIARSVSASAANMDYFASNEDDVVEVQDFEKLPTVLDTYLDKIPCPDSA